VEQQVEAVESATRNAVSAAPVVAETINGDRPAMWRVADSDTEIFLFGTFHLITPGTEWTSDAMKAAMVGTGVTYFEADTSSPEGLQSIQQAVQQYGLNPPGVTLSSTLGAERAAKFKSIADQYGVPMANLEPLRPWLASLSVTLVAYQQAGLDPNSGAEMILTGLAKEQGDEIRFLESGESQIIALASLDDNQDFSAFDDGIDQLGNLKEEILALQEAWRSGNVAVIEEQIVASIRDVSEPAFQALLVRRNENWVVQINDLMASDGQYFIAVGAGHLVGEESVVDMLRKQGFTVTRVQ